MSVRNLDKLFQPKSVALIGASNRDKSVGQVVARNLFHSGFSGPVMPVNPKAEAVEGVLAYADVDALPFAPDLAIVCTPPDTVAPIVSALGARGTKACVVITAGFGEGGSEAGHRRLKSVLDAARPHTLRVVGPNCVGTMVPPLGLNGSFAHIGAEPGDLAFLTQSGAMVTAMLDWATPRGIGFSKVVSLGDMADVDFGDLLDYLAGDRDTRAILLYVEAVTHARKFMSAARAAARAKPVIVIKGGRHAEGAKAAASHTGALAGSDAVYDAAFKRAGMLRVDTLEELFDAAETLATTARQARTVGERLAILTNGGGLGVLATDALIGEGGTLAELSPETIERLDTALPATWSRGNPVDIIGDAPGERYEAALSGLLTDRSVDAVLVMHCPVAVADPLESALATVRTLESHQLRSGGQRKPVFTAWLGERAPREARKLFAEKKLPTYGTPEQAVRAFMHLVRYRENQEMLMETAASIPDHRDPDTAAVRRILDAALDEGREWLSEPEAKRVLAAYGIPTVQTREVADAEAALAAAEELGYPVALKILSPDITHKSDVGGVKLDIEGPDQLRRESERMLRRCAAAKPAARLTGFSVQQMARRPGAYELILGILDDLQFGPVVLFGQGGTAVEVIKDKALALPPLNMALARTMMRETRIHRLLEGFRDTPAVDLDAVGRAMIDLAQLAADFQEVAEVDINPLLADPDGVLALDARVKVQPAPDPERRAAWRLAIRPYPKHLESQETLRDGTPVFVRPIRPEDEAALIEAYTHLTPEDVHMRFFHYMKALSHETAARLTQIDYEREMALVCLPQDRPDELWGVVRIAADPDNRAAEYAVTVRSDLKGRGVGYLLMGKILAYAADRGIGEVWGDVLADNERMLQMNRELGFTAERHADDPQVVRVRKPLQPAPAPAR
jgi:acetyltransferase